jgi:hypothetical protein
MLEYKCKIFGKIFIQYIQHGDRSPMCDNLNDSDWIIILFPSILMLLEWNNLEELACKIILVAGPSLENWGPEPSGAILRH